MITRFMSATPISAGHSGTLKLHRDRGFGEVSLTPLQPRDLESPPSLENGTTHAISNLTFSVAANSVSSAGRGGARNRADRVSYELSRAQVGNLRAAERQAKQIGLPFTRMITIHWEGAGVPLWGMAKATGRFTDLLAKTLARHGADTAWLWTHESGAGKGGHCHMLAHVPANLVPRVAALQRGWLRRIAGRAYRAGVIHSKPIGARLGIEVANPDLHAVNLEVAFGYCCKAAPQPVLDAFQIDRNHEPGGLIIGKRCGTSQNIGAKARKAKD